MGLVFSKVEEEKEGTLTGQSRSIWLFVVHVADSFTLVWFSSCENWTFSMQMRNAIMESPELLTALWQRGAKVANLTLGGKSVLKLWPTTSRLTSWTGASLGRNLQSQL